ALVYPWFKRLDMNVTQDIYLKTGKDRHTLRFSLDITNLGNLIDRNAGLYTMPTVSTPLKFDKVTTVNGQNFPVFSFPYLNGTTPYTSSFRNNTAAISRWQMQFGLRYLFN
ncbi:MAG: TonB-dependent receptor, partial [Bacteroidota bacterium]|nr:TonB-dependent receptor [Bacteroidota bacterium]